MQHRYIGYVDCLVGLLFVGLAVPLILNRVGMNGIYGVRIPKAFESEQNWYAINHIGGIWLAVAGAVVIVVGIVALVRPPTSEAAAFVFGIAPAVVALLTLVPILIYSARLG